VLAELENARLALAGTLGTPLPVRCLLLRNESDFAVYRPTPITRAFFQSGPDRDYIVLALEGGADGRVPREKLLHEYVHLYLHHATRPLPKWADEGLAEYYSTMEFRPGRVRVGAPVERHRALLAKSAALSAGQMMAVTGDSPEYVDGDRANAFYASAWAAIYGYAWQHEGRPPLNAEAFGEQALTGYWADYRANSTKLNGFTWPMDQTAPDAVTRSISDVKAALMQADLLLRLSKLEAARRLLEALTTMALDSSTLERGLALVAVAQGDAPEAARRFERAIKASDADADAFFEYAVYLKEREGGTGRVAGLLAETTRRNPNHAEAQYLQGRELARDGRAVEAVAYFERAIEVLPREPLFRAALEAAQESLRAKSETVDGVRVPASWNMPAADARLTGTLDQVDCGEGQARLKVRSGDRLRSFEVRTTDRIEIRGANGAQMELICGAQRRSVELEFILATGAVTAITFQ
jgi:tetratricopeptide (TPR) repeat protein